MKNKISTNNAASAPHNAASASHNAASATPTNIMQNIISTNNIDKNSLEKISKSQLINMLLQLNAQINMLIQQNAVQQPIPVPMPRTKKPVPTPRKSVKQMVQEYEDNIILPPLEFRDDYKPIPKPRTKKPVPLPRTKIEQVDKALKGYSKSFEIGIKNNKDPLVQLQSTRKALEHHIISILTSMKGLKFVETLRVTFTKPLGSDTLYKTAYFNGAAQTIINNQEVTESLQSSQQHILNKTAQWVSEGSGWTIQSVDNHYLNIVKYQPMNGSSYIELPPELRNSSKGLINIKNEDNECFRWCHIRHLNPQDNNPQRIKKADKVYVDQLNYNGIKFPVTTKKYNKIEKQNEININVFGYENKQPYPIYVSKEKYDDHMNLLYITENENKRYVLIKDFNAFMHSQTKSHQRKHFCMYCLQCFSSERVLYNHKDNCIKINGTQAVKMPTDDSSYNRL